MARIIKATEIDGAKSGDVAAMTLHEFPGDAPPAVIDAQKQADRILAHAHDQAKVIKLQADQAGYAEGFARGRREGAAAGELKAHEEVREQLADRTEKIVQQARAIVAQLAEARKALAPAAKGEAIRFAIAIAERIVGHVAVKDVAAARNNLAKAMELADARGRISVRVNPAQLEELREHCAELVGLLGPRGEVELTGDEGVSPGGVKLLCGAGEIDATIETQLANVTEALLGTNTANAGPRHRQANAAGTC